MSIDFDAVVIGAGPAGSMAAWEFAAAGWRVLLLDRHHFPRDKACGGALVARALSAVPFDLSPVIERRIVWQASNEARRSDAFAFVPVGGLFMTTRRRLDAFLVRQAVARGADLRSGVTVRTVVESGDHVRVHTSEGEYRAGCAVLACGAGLALTRDGHLKASGNLPAFALEGCIALPQQTTEGNAFRIPDVMHYDYRFPASGYAWIFPTANSLNVGLASFHFSEAPLSRAMIAERFAAVLAVSGGQLTAVRGAPLGVGGLGYMPRGRILRAGDAAGFTSDSTGEGISAALLSGRLAARACIESVARNGYPAADIYLTSLKIIRQWLRLQRQNAIKLYGR